MRHELTHTSEEAGQAAVDTVSPHPCPLLADPDAPRNDRQSTRRDPGLEGHAGSEVALLQEGGTMSITPSSQNGPARAGESGAR